MPKNTSIFKTSHEPAALVNAALDFASSDDPADQTILAGVLNSDDFLARLNTAREYETLTPTKLRVGSVLQELRDTPHAAAKQTLSSLAQGGTFIGDNWRRQELLVRALAGVRPASEAAVRYWDTQSQPASVNRHITIEMLCENGTEPAMALLERKLLDPAHKQVYKVSWVHKFVLPHRNELPLLGACQRMILRATPAELPPLLLETLCDYDTHWYRVCEYPRPPLRQAMAQDARQVLREICHHAKSSMQLTPTLELAVEKTLVEIGDPDNEPAG